MDFPSSGVSRNPQAPFRNSAVHHSMFGTPSSLFGQANLFGNTGRGGGVSRNQFNFPLRSHGGSTSNAHGGQYSSYSRANEPVVRQSMYGPPLQSEPVLNNFIQKPSGAGVQNNRRPYRQAGYGSQAKTANGKEKFTTKRLTQISSTKDQPEQTQQQYRIFKRGDTIPGVSNPNPVIVNESCGSDPSVCEIKSKSEVNGDPSSTECSILDSGSGNAENISSNGTSLVADVPSASDVSLKTLSVSGKENVGCPNGLNGASSNRNAISIVSEIAKFHGLALEYRLVKETGPPHAPTFTVNLTLGTEEYQGCGSSIKRAQHAAAMDAMDKTSFITPPPRTQPKRNFVGNGQKRPNWALIQLTSLAEEMKQSLSFALQPMTIIDPFYRREPPSLVTVHFGERVFTGEGPSFNAAKNAATIIALKTLIKEKHEMELAKMLAEGVDLLNIEEQNLNSESKSPISVVHEMALKRGLTVCFDVTNESGPPHMKVFTVKCNVGEHETEGQGSTKQQAKKISSEMMISKLREINISLPNVNALGSTLKSIQRGFIKTRVTKKKSTPIVKDVDKQSVSPISRLIQIAHSKKLKEPEFRLVAQPQATEINEISSTQGNKNDRRNKRRSALFTLEVCVGPHICQGTGINKKTAKKAAAEAALIALGCVSAEVEPSKIGGTLMNSVSKELSSTNSAKMNDGEDSSSQCSSPSKNKMSNTSSRQIVPGVLVRKSEDSQPSTPIQSSAVAQELQRVNSTNSTYAATEKLNHLAVVFSLNISFSDFPKKDEFLSVVSFGATPPHVAHGIGKIIEEARNSAAQKILDELTDLGIDSVTNKQYNDDGANGL